MAIRNIKEIIDNKGYTINPKDRKIFQEEDLQSFFGVSGDDLIEVIIYDANDNQLPQGTHGYVRYIPLTTENINEYFLIAEGTKFSKNNLPEYFIDVERILREAGYNTGIFKTQITLINKRIGSYVEGDSLWIRQISPSRTEVRLVPLERSKNIEDIKKRFNIVYSNSNFSADVLPYIREFLEKTTVPLIEDFVEQIGKTELKRIFEEFSINEFDEYLEKVYADFTDKVNDEFLYNPTDGIELSVDCLEKRCKDIFKESIDNHLMNRSIADAPELRESKSLKDKPDIKYDKKQITDTETKFDTEYKQPVTITQQSQAKEQQITQL